MVFFYYKIVDFVGPTLPIFPIFLQFLLLKSDYSSSNLKKQALPLVMRLVLVKNIMYLPKTSLRSNGKARFLRLELNIGHAKGSKYIL